MKIVVNLDVMMARRKMSLGELAQKVDITMANLSILKNNKARAIRFSTLEAICAALDCQPRGYSGIRAGGGRPMKALPILLVLLMLWSAIWRPGDYVARELELELPTAQTTDTYDDHGGFHGDGLLHTELTFSPEDGARVEEAVSHHPSGRWNPFPMDDKMESFLYRGGAAELAGWTVPERGWWYLLDRQEDREGQHVPAILIQLHPGGVRQRRRHPVLSGI